MPKHEYRIKAPQTFYAEITDGKSGVVVTPGFVAAYCGKNYGIRKDFIGPGTAFWRT